jgi:hypothetical protein
MIDVFIAGVTVALGTAFALGVNRRTSVAQTVFCFLAPVSFGLLAWVVWGQWQSAPPNPAGGGYPYSIEFGCWCATTAMFLIALGRRIWWLRHHHHEGWTGWGW